MDEEEQLLSAKVFLGTESGRTNTFTPLEHLNIDYVFVDAAQICKYAHLKVKHFTGRPFVTSHTRECGNSITSYTALHKTAV